MNRPLILFLGLACAATLARAHVTLEYAIAPAGASYKATFRVGHGCEGSATRQVAVTLPVGAKGARPMRKPGWDIDIREEGGNVSQVTWTAKSPGDALPDRFYDEFVLVATMPKEPGSVRWPVVQTCERGHAEWAPELELMPADAGAGAHQH